MISEVDAAADDGIVGPTSEWGTADGGRLRATATTEVGSPDFFPASNRYLRFPSDLQNFLYENRLDFFAIRRHFCLRWWENLCFMGVGISVL